MVLVSLFLSFSKKIKKIILPFCLSLPLPSPLLPFPSSYLFAFFISTFTPTTNMKGYPCQYLSALWGESPEPFFRDLVPHSATRFTLMPYRSNRVKQTHTLSSITDRCSLLAAEKVHWVIWGYVNAFEVGTQFVVEVPLG